MDGGVQAQENPKTFSLHRAVARGEAGTIKEARWNTTWCERQRRETDRIT